MTDEEQVLKSLEDLVKEAESKMETEFTDILMKSVVYFRDQSTEHLVDKDKSGVHLFVISQVDDDQIPNGVVMADPFSLKDEPHANCWFGHFFRFDDAEEATTMMLNPKSSVVMHHASDGKQIGLFVVQDKSTYLMYVNNRLVIHQVVSPSESLTHMADILNDDPDEFYDKAKVTKDTKQLSVAMVFLAEAGRDFKARMPEVYNLIIKRLTEEQDDESDD